LTKESRLTADDKEKLNSLIKEAQTKGSIREFQVAVWSDNPAPRENEQLSKNDRELASRRASLVSKYLRSKSKEGVSSYNMAERASQ
jgi:hypothetical protein